MDMRTVIEVEIGDKPLAEGMDRLEIIDPEGVLKYAVVTDDNVGRSVEETIRVLQALQTGGLCPAEWKPGKALLQKV